MSDTDIVGQQRSIINTNGVVFPLVFVLFVTACTPTPQPPPPPPTAEDLTTRIYALGQIDGQVFDPPRRVTFEQLPVPIQKTLLADQEKDQIEYERRLGILPEPAERTIEILEVNPKPVGTSPSVMATLGYAGTGILVTIVFAGLIVLLTGSDKLGSDMVEHTGRFKAPSRVVEGVSIAYEYNGEKLIYVDATKPCKYQRGKATALIGRGYPTKIKPNAKCSKHKSAQSTVDDSSRAEIGRALTVSDKPRD